MKVLLLNQCFYPDVVSTAQHLTDLALELAAQGHEVTVVAGRRGYDDTEARFPARERWRGVDIIRIPTLGLGKKARWRRAADFASFLMCCVLRLLVVPRQDAVVALTSPPLISLPAPRTDGTIVPDQAISGSQFFILKQSWPGGDPTITYNHFATITLGFDVVGQLTSSDRILSVEVKRG